MIIVPYIPDGLRDETRDSVLAYADGRDVRFEQLFTDESYFYLWEDLWTLGENLIVVEQDVVPNPDTFSGFDACPDPWCAHAYPYSIFGLYPGTGCVRFRKELIAATHDLWERVGQMSDATHPPKHWCRLDGWSKQLLAHAGYTLHVHQPPVEHLGSGTGHGCVEAQLAAA